MASKKMAPESIFQFSGEEKKDPEDCHQLPFLKKWLGKRAIINTTKGTIKGRLEYPSGWYYCQAPFQLIRGEWKSSYYRFCFRKSDFRRIESVSLENSAGI